MQAIGELRADPVRVLGQLVGDLVGGPALSGKVPDHGLEELASLALGGAALIRSS